MDALAISCRGSVQSWRSTSLLTASASAGLSVMSTALAILSCSA